MKQPCKRDCENRGPGCAASCPLWAEYVKARDQEYQSRADAMRVNDVIYDGRQRRSKAAKT